MSRSISSAMRADITAPQSGFALLEMLEISSDELTETLYFVKNNVDVVSNGITYTAANFSANMPSQQESTTQETTITISGINRQITEAIRTLTESPDMSLFYVRESALDTVELGPYTFKLRSVTYDKTSVSGSLLYEYTLRNNISRVTITSKICPGIF